MAKSSAIYLHDKGALAVRVEGSASKPRLTHASELIYDIPETYDDGDPIPFDEKLDIQRDDLKKWLKTEGFTSGVVSLFVPHRDVILRELQVDFSDRRQIDKIIAFQVEGVIPSTPIEDLAVTYHVMESGDNGSRLLVAAAHINPVTDHLNDLEDIRVTPQMADSGVGGALTLRTLVPELANADVPTLWIDLQETHAMISVLEGEGIRTVRVVRVPAEVVSELREAARSSAEAERAAVAEAAEQDTDAEDGGEDSAEASDRAPIVVMAENQSDEPSAEVELPVDDQVAATAPENLPAPIAQQSVSTASDDARVDALKRMLSVEARRVILSSASDAPIERVIVTGVPASLERLMSGLQTGLGVSDLRFVDVVDDLIPRTKNGERSVDLPPSGLMSALTGVALRGLGVKGSEMDFLTGELSPTDTFDEIRVPLLSGLSLALVLVLLAFYITWREYREELNHRDGLLTQVFQKKSWDATFASAPEGFGAPAYLGGKPADSMPARDQINWAHKTLTSQIQSIRAGDKGNAPPMFEAGRIYDELLKGIRTKLETENGKPREPRNFHLVKFNFSHRTVSATGSEGELTIEAWMEDGKQAQFERLVKEIEVENPVFDDKTVKEKTIKPFEKSVFRITPENNVRERGERREGNRNIKIFVRKYRISVPTEKIVRGGAASSGRP